MSIRKVASTLAVAAAVGGAGIAGYLTRDRWMPFVFPAGSAAPAGDAHDHEHDEAGHAHAHDRGDRVKLSSQAQANLNLDVDALSPQEYWRTLLIPGVVVERPGESDRRVTARAAGVVTAVRARPGDTVRPGDPLFTVLLVSEFLQTTQAELAKAAQEYRIAAARRDRLTAAARDAPLPETTLVEAENQVARTATQVRAYRRQLLTFGLTPDQADRAERGEAVTEVTVTAPGQPGGPVLEVQDLRVQLGEQVQAGQTLCLLADHQQLFVEGRAFKSEARALARAAELKLPVQAEFADEAAGDWPTQGPLVVHHLSNQVDPATRTFAFYLPLANHPTAFERDGKTYLVWRYRPGQRVRLRVPVEKLGDDVFVLPAGAVVREGGEAFVFRQNGDLFERRPVRVLFEDRAEVVIAPGGEVGPGQFVVRNNAAAVNRALKAAADGGGHEGHDHAGHSHDH